MNIVDTQVNINRRALEIYVSGCLPPNCPGCHNKVIQDFSMGKHCTSWFPKIQQMIKTHNTLINEFWILGGEPLDQNLDELYDLIVCVKSVKPEMKIFLFTRYDLRLNSEKFSQDILNSINYIKCGMYKENDIPKNININNKVITLASSNQKIYKKEESEWIEL